MVDLQAAALKQNTQTSLKVNVLFGVLFHSAAPQTESCDADRTLTLQLFPGTARYLTYRRIVRGFTAGKTEKKSRVLFFLVE